MNINELDNIIRQIDISLDKQINLVSLQLEELKQHICTVEKLIQQMKKEKYS